MSHSACNDPKCAEMVEGRVKTCPKCGGTMRSVGESPLLGIVMLSIGLFLIVMIGGITYYLAPSLLHPGEAMADGGSFNGTAEQARLVLALFGLLILFGLIAAANGVFMIVARRQSWFFIAATLILAALIVVAGFAIMWALPSP